MGDEKCWGTNPGSAVPVGLVSFLHRDPAMNHRAIVGCPGGTKIRRQEGGMRRRVVSGPDQSGGGPPQFKTLEHFQQSCSAGLRSERRRSFCPWASFRLSYRVRGTCAFAKASPKDKNPRRPPLHLCCQCSSARHQAADESGAFGCAGGHRHRWGKLKAWVGRRRRAEDCAPYHSPVTGRGFGGLRVPGSGRRQMEISANCKQFKPPCSGGYGGGDKFLPIPFYTPPALG